MTELTKEKKYEQVYGDTFALYSRADMQEFIHPFEVRFKRNNIDPRELFEGKRCLDAGCGNGRGTLFMLMNGAKHVTAFDFSEKNIESTTKFVKEFGFSAVDCKQGSLEKVPFESESFDFIWCNGVIMHTAHPNNCLAELSRVLKPGGKMWLYIYGSGGVYWRIIYQLRSLVKDIPIDACISALRLMRYETRYVAEFIDDWYASYLRSYTNADLSARLSELGFESPALLKYGTDYDTSHRLNTFMSERERALMGEGDLRYVLKKSDRKPAQGAKLLDEGEFGSDYAWPKLITDEIDPMFKNLKDACKGDSLLLIAASARIQRELRLILTESKPFPLDEMKNVISSTIAMAQGFRG